MSSDELTRTNPGLRDESVDSGRLSDYTENIAPQAASEFIYKGEL